MADSASPSSADMLVVISLLRQGLAEGHHPFLTVISGSMRPLLQIGDEIQIEPVQPDQLRLGELIVVANRETLVTHRLVAVGGKGLVTQGDWAHKPDPPFAPEDLLGRVICRRRDGRLVALSGPGAGEKSDAIGRLAARRRALIERLPRPLHRPVRALFLVYTSAWCKINF